MACRLDAMQLCPFRDLGSTWSPRYYGPGMMNALVLDGFHNETGQAVLTALREALSQAGYEAEIITLRERTIAPCLGCFSCWVKTPGECVIDDEGRDVARSIARCNLLVYFTPVTFGGVSSELKRALDRMIPNISPFFARVEGETHHQRRYRHSLALIGLGLLPQADREAETLFKTLIERNALNLRTSRIAAAVVVPGSPTDIAARLHDLVEAVAR